MNQFYKTITNQEINEYSTLPMFDLRDMYDNNLTLSENLIKNLKFIANKFKLDLITDIEFKSDNPIELSKEVFKTDYSQNKKEITHYFLTRISGYAFELYIINKFNLTPSKLREDKYEKIDAWDNDNNAYSITLKWKSHRDKVNRGNFRKMKQNPKVNDTYSIYIGFDNEIKIELIK